MHSIGPSLCRSLLGERNKICNSAKPQSQFLHASTHPTGNKKPALRLYRRVDAALVEQKERLVRLAGI